LDRPKKKPRRPPTPRLLPHGTRARLRDRGFDHFVGRLLPDGTYDDTFDGNGVLRIDMVPGEDDGARAIALVGGRPVIAGVGGADAETATLLRLQSDLIFTDGFAN
jgi:hypothetical protein